MIFHLKNNNMQKHVFCSIVFDFSGIILFNYSKKFKQHLLCTTAFRKVDKFYWSYLKTSEHFSIKFLENISVTKTLYNEPKL